MKKIFFSVIILSLALALIGAGCGSGGTSDGGNPKATTVRGDVGGNLCEEFDADFTYSAIGKPIAYMNASPLGDDLTYCQYYTEYSDDYYKIPGSAAMPGGPWISINAEDLSVDNQKKAAEFMEWTIKTAESIKMENFMVYQKDGLLNEIYLVINPNRFVSLGRSSGEVISEEEMIRWASLVAEKIQGKLSIDIQKNPLGNTVKPWGKPLNYVEEGVGESQKAVAESFLNFMAEKKWDEAIAMMDANDATKAMWKTNFQTINSLKVKKLEPVFEEEWTAERQVFKADLETSVTSQGEEWGWNNGVSMRWISLQRNNGVWQIHELANNP